MDSCWRALADASPVLLSIFSSEKTQIPALSGAPALFLGIKGFQFCFMHSALFTSFVVSICDCLLSLSLQVVEQKINL